MKKRTLRKILLLSFALLSFSLTEVNAEKIHAESASISYLPSSISCVVTASDYVNFLNDAAKSDPNFSYDEKMGVDSQAASVVRSGVPGDFHYEVITGRENEPITFVNENNANAYCKWNKTKLQDDASFDDSFLKSNESDFQIAIPSSLSLSLASSSISHLPSSNQTSTSDSNSYLKGALFIIGSITAVACHELMIRDSDSSLRNEASHANDESFRKIAEDSSLKKEVTSTRKKEATKNSRKAKKASTNPAEQEAKAALRKKFENINAIKQSITSLKNKLSFYQEELSTLTTTDFSERELWQQAIEHAQRGIAEHEKNLESLKNEVDQRIIDTSLKVAQRSEQIALFYSSAGIMSDESRRILKTQKTDESTEEALLCKKISDSYLNIARALADEADSATVDELMKKVKDEEELLFNNHLSKTINELTSSFQALAKRTKNINMEMEYIFKYLGFLWPPSEPIDGMSHGMAVARVLWRPVASYCLKTATYYHLRSLEDYPYTQLWRGAFRFAEESFRQAKAKVYSFSGKDSIRYDYEYSLCKNEEAVVLAKEHKAARDSANSYFYQAAEATLAKADLVVIEQLNQAGEAAKKAEILLSKAVSTVEYELKETDEQNTLKIGYLKKTVEHAHAASQYYLDVADAYATGKSLDLIKRTEDKAVHHEELVSIYKSRAKEKKTLLEYPDRTPEVGIKREVQKISDRFFESLDKYHQAAQVLESFLDKADNPLTLAPLRRAYKRVRSMVIAVSNSEKEAREYIEFLEDDGFFIYEEIESLIMNFYSLIKKESSKVHDEFQKMRSEAIDIEHQVTVIQQADSFADFEDELLENKTFALWRGFKNNDDDPNATLTRFDEEVSYHEEFHVENLTTAEQEIERTFEAAIANPVIPMITANAGWRNAFDKAEAKRIFWGDKTLAMAAAGKGMFQLPGDACREDAIALGYLWVGVENEDEIISLNGIISKDGLRRFRFPSVKAFSDRYQANFEWRDEAPPSWEEKEDQMTRWPNNGHLNIY